MDKKKMLSILRKSLYMYEQAVIAMVSLKGNDRYLHLKNNHLECDFCDLLYFLIYKRVKKSKPFCYVVNQSEKVMKEIDKDYIISKPGPSAKWYLEPSLCKRAPKRILNECLLPRVEHLKRTIKRIERELNL